MGSAAAALRGTQWVVLSYCFNVFKRWAPDDLGQPLRGSRRPELPPDVGAESKPHHPQARGCFWTAPALLGRADIPAHGVQTLPPTRRLGGWASSSVPLGKALALVG